MLLYVLEDVFIDFQVKLLSRENCWVHVCPAVHHSTTHTLDA